MTKTVDDIDPIETQERLEALASVVDAEGIERARYLLQRLLEKAGETGIPMGQGALVTPFCNTFSLEQQPPYPGDLKLEKRIDAINRWNAIVMVLRAKKTAGGVG